MIYFIADLHLGCAKMVEIRKRYLSIVEHDQTIIRAINAVVDRGDTLYLLGDFACRNWAAYRQQINCKHIFFVLGNHDQESKLRPIFGQHIWHQKMVRVAPGIHIYCSHYPHAYWDGCHRGTLHCYGHTHYSVEREEAMDFGMPGRRSMDVGVDAALHHFNCPRPFSAKEVVETLLSRPGHDIIPGYNESKVRALQQAALQFCIKPDQSHPIKDEINRLLRAK